LAFPDLAKILRSSSHHQIQPQPVTPHPVSST
jgi:hypothetical protein